MGMRRDGHMMVAVLDYKIWRDLGVVIEQSSSMSSTPRSPRVARSSRYNTPEMANADPDPTRRIWHVGHEQSISRLDTRVNASSVRDFPSADGYPAILEVGRSDFAFSDCRCLTASA